MELISITARGAAFGRVLRMGIDSDIAEIARAMIRSYGARAPELVNRRAERFLSHGDAESAWFLLSVCSCTSRILSGHRGSPIGDAV